MPAALREAWRAPIFPAMRLLRALIHLIVAVALIGAVPMPAALSAPPACDHHSAGQDRNAQADRSGMRHHAAVPMADDTVRPHSAPANAPIHKWNCCQTICCFVPSQLSAASEASTVTFARAVHYWNFADRALGRTETPEPGIPKAEG